MVPQPSPSATLTCEICRQSYARKSDLHRHLKTHASDKQPFLYSCPWLGCPYKALQWSNLQTHIGTHTGVKSKLCPHAPCTFRTNDPASLTKHRKRKHGYVPKPRAPRAGGVTKKDAKGKARLEVAARCLSRFEPSNGLASTADVCERDFFQLKQESLSPMPSAPYAFTPSGEVVEPISLKDESDYPPSTSSMSPRLPILFSYRMPETFVNSMQLADASSPADFSDLVFTEYDYLRSSSTLSPALFAFDASASYDVTRSIAPKEEYNPTYFGMELYPGFVGHSYAASSYSTPSPDSTCGWGAFAVAHSAGFPSIPSPGFSDLASSPSSSSASTSSTPSHRWTSPSQLDYGYAGQMGF